MGRPTIPPTQLESSMESKSLQLSKMLKHVQNEKEKSREEQLHFGMATSTDTQLHGYFMKEFTVDYKFFDIFIWAEDILDYESNVDYIDIRHYANLALHVNDLREKEEQLLATGK
ncbi:hypothetical protein V8E54_007497 [Elaphomyces granulatus]